MSGHPVPAKQQGAVIIIPKQLRAEWMDTMALDVGLSNLAFRVAAVIGSHFNRFTGKTYIAQETLARVMGVSERTVFGGIKELEAAGYLIVDRREFGAVTRQTAKGEIRVRVAGGKVANRYYPAFQRSQLSATNKGTKLAEFCDRVWEDRSQNLATNPGSKVAKSCDLSGADRSQNPAGKVARFCDRTLASPSEKYPTAPTEAAGQVGQASSAATDLAKPEPLGAAAAELRKRLSEGVFAAWFSQAKIVSVCGDTVTISVDTKFKRSRIVAQYDADCIAAFRASNPLINRVDVVVEARP